MRLVGYITHCVIVHRTQHVNLIVLMVPITSQQIYAMSALQHGGGCANRSRNCNMLKATKQHRPAVVQIHEHIFQPGGVHIGKRIGMLQCIARGLQGLGQPCQGCLSPETLLADFQLPVVVIDLGSTAGQGAPSWPWLLLIMSLIMFGTMGFARATKDRASKKLVQVCQDLALYLGKLLASMLFSGNVQGSYRTVASRLHAAAQELKPLVNIKVRQPTMRKLATRRDVTRAGGHSDCIMDCACRSQDLVHVQAAHHCSLIPDSCRGSC